MISHWSQHLCDVPHVWSKGWFFGRVHERLQLAHSIPHTCTEAETSRYATFAARRRSRTSSLSRNRVVLAKIQLRTCSTRASSSSERWRLSESIQSVSRTENRCGMCCWHSDIRDCKTASRFCQFDSWSTVRSGTKKTTPESRWGIDVSESISLRIYPLAAMRYE